jgi:hypothetical protein
MGWGRSNGGEWGRGGIKGEEGERGRGRGKEGRGEQRKEGKGRYMGLLPRAPQTLAPPLPLT